MKTWLGTAWVLVWKDLVQEWRSRDVLTSMFSFAVLSLFIFNYALELSPIDRAEIAPGLIWVVMVFAGTLGLNRSFAAEQDQGSFEGLMMAVPELSVIYLAKMITNLLMMFGLAILVIPIYSLLYNQSLFDLRFFGILMLGAWGYSAAGTLISSMTVQTRMRDLLLPVLLFPLLLPVNMAVVKSGSAIITVSALPEFQSWINLLLVYDVIMTVVSLMVFEYVIRE
ncbi:MAG TPA: cytochrome C biogenesis protein [Anaerolineaceae bacterium]|nr:cytochrome C biogenesis protein [Anaerolineaceae bacterium]